MIDTTKLGIATARAMDSLERYVESGDITEGAAIGAVVIVCALDAPTPDDHPDREFLRSVATQCFVFAEPEEVYIQNGVLHMALGNYGTADDD